MCSSEATGRNAANSATISSVMARPRSKSAQAKMLETTRDMILEHGVYSCSIDDVARRSGVAKTTIYRHYGGLDELIFAAVESNVSQAAAPDKGSLHEDLCAIQAGYVAAARSSTARELFVWMTTKALQDPRHAALFRKARVQPRGPTTIALQRAIARGELLPSIDIDMALHTIQGPFISKRIVDDSDISETEIDTMVGMAIRALRP